MNKSETIWMKFHSELKYFVRTKVKDKETCDDILQDVFIKLHTNINAIDREHIKSWLYQVTRNTITDHFRKQKKTTGLAENDLPEKEGKNMNEKFAECMLSFVNKLPAKYKEAITEAELNNLGQLQLAEKLDISYSGVKSRVQRGRELLKSLFLKCCRVSTDKYGNIISHQTKSNCSTCGF